MKNESEAETVDVFQKLTEHMYDLGVKVSKIEGKIESNITGLKEELKSLKKDIEKLKKDIKILRDDLETYKKGTWQNMATHNRVAIIIGVMMVFGNNIVSLIQKIAKVFFSIE